MLVAALAVLGGLRPPTRPTPPLKDPCDRRIVDGTGQECRLCRPIDDHYPTRLLADSSLTRIARAVRWIRDHYAQSFRVEDVAQLSGMSVSAFYRNFQAVTAMSPIQFQKQIRLQEARLLLAARPTDVTGVGRLVGYDSPSQFSREYRRQFGAPPSQDAVSLRAAPARW